MRRLIALSCLCLACALALDAHAAGGATKPSVLDARDATGVPSGFLAFDDRPHVTMRSDGGAWVATGSVLSSIDAQRREEARVDMEALGLGNLLHVAVDAYDGSVWVTTDLPLLLHFAANGALVFGSMLPGHPSALAVDLAERAWVVTGGVLLQVAVDGRTLQTRRLELGEEEDVRALLVDNFRDRLWLATSEGLYEAPTGSALQSLRRVLRGNVSGVAIDQRSGKGIALVDEAMIAFEDATPSAWPSGLAGVDEAVTSVLYDEDAEAFVGETARATLRVGTDGRLLDRNDLPDRPQQIATPLRIDPVLVLVRPPSGGAIVDTSSEIVLQTAALCNGRACDVPLDYLRSMHVTAGIDALPPETRAADASGGVTFRLPPGMGAGEHRFSARVTDMFGHTASLGSVRWTVVASASSTEPGETPTRNDGTNAKAANKVPGVSLTSPVNGAVFVAGSDIVLTANATDSDGSITKVEFYRGTTLIGTATASPYRTTWTQAAAGNYSVTATAYDDRKGSATSSAVSVSVVNNQAPSVIVSAPPPGTFAMIGTPITLAAAASDADGTVASVEFFDGTNSIGVSTHAPYEVAWIATTPGTHSIGAKATDDHGAVTRSAPLYVAVGGPPVVVMTTPETCSSVDGPLDAVLAADATSASGKIASVEFFDNGSPVGSAIAPPWRAVLLQAGVGSHSITAKATDAHGLTTLSRASSFTVRAQNQPPSAALTSPADGARFAFGSTVALQASANDVDGSVTAVEFRLNGSGGALIARVTQAPYAATWSSVAAGSYAVVAVAYDDRGASATSAPIHITVDPNVAPSVILTAPLPNTRLVVNEDVTLAANATDSDGSIVRVDFYAGTVLVGSSTTAPYAIVWKPAAARAYTLTARATDNAGSVSTSAPVSVDAVANVPPTVALAAAPPDGDLFAPATIVLAADARDSDGSIARVDFYAGTTLIGHSSGAPYRLVWDGVPAGTYALTATAIDDAGSATTSAPVILTVATGPSISIDPAIVGVTVLDDNVLVRGFVSAPPNAAVTVNGVVTHIDDLGRFNANEVPLLPGSNTVMVEVTTQSGQSARQSINVDSTGAGAFVVHASPTEGLETLQVTFTIENPSNTPFKQMLFDLDNDGQPNLIFTPEQFTDGKVTLTATYPEGTWLAVLKVYDDQDRVIYTTSRSIVVRIPQILQIKLLGIYDGMLNRLRAGNIAGALTAFTGSAYDKYDAILAELQPSLAEIVDQLGEVMEITFNGDLAELTVVRNGPDGPVAFLIYMLRAEDGIWRIDGM